MHFIKNKSNIYVPSLSPPSIKMGCKFQVEKFRSDGTITYKGPEFENTVLDCGLDALVSYSIQTMIGYCNVGTGTTTPDITQTELSAFKAASSTLYGALVVNYNTSPLVHLIFNKTFVFAVGTATGNLTELGLSRLSNSAYFNRQLFKDLNGNPTTITVLADEGIRISVKLYCYPGMQAADQRTGSFIFKGQNIDYILKMNMASNLGFLDDDGGSISGVNGIIGKLDQSIVAEISTALTGFPDGNNASSWVQEAYVAGSFERTCTYKWLAANLVGTINTISFNIGNSTIIGNRLYAFYLTPGIEKLDTEEFTFTLKRSWGRYVAP